VSSRGGMKALSKHWLLDPEMHEMLKILVLRGILWQ
jgi:hypothetical protein